MKEIIKNIITVIGIALFALGMSTADSECLLVPFVLLLAGGGILFWSTKDIRKQLEEEESE